MSLYFKIMDMLGSETWLLYELGTSLSFRDRQDKIYTHFWHISINYQNISLSMQIHKCTIYNNYHYYMYININTKEIACTQEISAQNPMSLWQARQKFVTGKTSSYLVFHQLYRGAKGIPNVSEKALMMIYFFYKEY